MARSCTPSPWPGVRLSHVGQGQQVADEQTGVWSASLSHLFTGLPIYQSTSLPVTDRVAEREGFEPSRAVNPTRFRDARTRPDYATSPRRGDYTRTPPLSQITCSRRIRLARNRPKPGGGQCQAGSANRKATEVIFRRIEAEATHGAAGLWPRVSSASDKRSLASSDPPSNETDEKV